MSEHDQKKPVNDRSKDKSNRVRSVSTGRLGPLIRLAKSASKKLRELCSNVYVFLMIGVGVIALLGIGGFAVFFLIIIIIKSVYVARNEIRGKSTSDRSTYLLSNFFEALLTLPLYSEPRKKNVHPHVKIRLRTLLPFWRVFLGLVLVVTLLSLSKSFTNFMHHFLIYAPYFVEIENGITSSIVRRYCLYCDEYFITLYITLFGIVVSCIYYAISSIFTPRKTIILGLNAIIRWDKPIMCLDELSENNSFKDVVQNLMPTLKTAAKGIFVATLAIAVFVAGLFVATDDQYFFLTYEFVTDLYVLPLLMLLVGMVWTYLLNDIVAVAWLIRTRARLRVSR